MSPYLGCSDLELEVDRVQLFLHASLTSAHCASTTDDFNVGHVAYLGQSLLTDLQRTNNHHEISFAETRHLLQKDLKTKKKKQQKKKRYKSPFFFVLWESVSADTTAKILKHVHLVFIEHFDKMFLHFLLFLRSQVFARAHKV